MFDRDLSIFAMTSVKKYIEYLIFWCKIQLDDPVQARVRRGLEECGACGGRGQEEEERQVQCFSDILTYCLKY